MSCFRFVLTSVLATSLCLAGYSTVQQDDDLTIVIAAGQGAINILDHKLAAEAIVEVRNKEDKPVAGAHVLFLLPPTGARAVFPGEKDSMSVTTDINGRGDAGDMRPVGVGSFQITVHVEYGGKTAAAAIRQTNYATLAEAQAAGALPARSVADSQQEANSFNIQILEGDDGVNIIDKDSAVKPLVRIVDRNNLPVAGVAVAVAIVAARGGATAEFQSGGTTTKVTTNASGLAEAALLRPNGNGSFQVQMQANIQGQLLKTAITQTNYPTERAALDAGEIPGTSKGNLPDGLGKSLQVRIVDGNGGTNVIKHKIVAPQVVEVDDSENVPVAGVKVAFVLPAKRAPALFARGKSYMIATTDAKGRATAGLVNPKKKGAFRVIVLVAYQGVSTTSSIQQTNFSTIAAARKAGKTPGSSQDSSTEADASSKSGTTVKRASKGMSGTTKALLLIGIVAGAAGGAAEAAGVGKSNSTSTPSPAQNCTSLQNQTITAVQSAALTCNGSSTQAQCSAASTAAYSVWGKWCGCQGLSAPSSSFEALGILGVAEGGPAASAIYCQ